jgi:hypothetical protein
LPLSGCLVDFLPVLDYGFWAWDEDDCSHSFVECNTNFRTTDYFCVNFPQCFIDRVIKTAERDPQLFTKAFLVEVLVTDEIMRICRRAITKRNRRLIRIVKLPFRVGPRKKKLIAT